MADTEVTSGEEASPAVAGLLMRAETPEPSPSLESLTAPVDTAGLTAERAGIQKKRVETQSSINNLFTQRNEENRKRSLDAFNATGIQPGELQPWDADAAKEKYKTDPLESFGSLGSVFAMVAAAFTRQPMENALNAGAAAMTAIKDGKDEDYARAYKAFKDNTDLTLKRHAIMQQRYQDANQFANTDLATWRAETLAAATQFDDQQTLALLNAGYDSKVLELQQQRVKLDRDLRALSNEDMEQAIKRQVFKTGVESINEQFTDPNERAAYTLALYNHTFNKREPKPTDAAFGLWMSTEGYKKTPDEIIAKGIEIAQRSRPMNYTDSEIERRTSEIMKKEGLSYTAANDKARQSLKEAGASFNMTTLRAKAINEIMAKAEAAGKPISINEATAQYTRDQSIKLGQQQEAITSANNIIDAMIAVAEGPTDTTGLKGKLSWVGEAFGIVPGDKAHTFQQLGRTLQQQIEKAMPGDAKSRLAKDERAVYDTIVPGLGYLADKDTTVRGLQRLKTIINKKDLLADGGEEAPATADPLAEALRKRGIDPSKIK